MICREAELPTVINIPTYNIRSILSAGADSDRQEAVHPHIVPRSIKPNPRARHPPPISRNISGYTIRCRTARSRPCSGAEQAVPLHVHGHLAAVAARPVRDPAEVHDPVNGPVDDLAAHSSSVRYSG